MDSRSLYDCINKLVCTYAQVEDKRTAIDIAILNNYLYRSGGTLRWAAANNMVADSLTKRMCSDFLQLVFNTGQWSLSELGHDSQCKKRDILIVALPIESGAGVKLESTIGIARLETKLGTPRLQMGVTCPRKCCGFWVLQYHICIQYTYTLYIYLLLTPNCTVVRQGVVSDHGARGLKRLMVSVICVGVRRTHTLPQVHAYCLCVAQDSQRRQTF